MKLELPNSVVYYYSLSFINRCAGSFFILIVVDYFAKQYRGSIFQVDLIRKQEI